MKSIIFLKPFFKEMIWGGSRLGTDFGYDIPGDGEGDINGHKKKKTIILYCRLDLER